LEFFHFRYLTEAGNSLFLPYYILIKQYIILLDNISAQSFHRQGHVIIIKKIQNLIVTKKIYVRL